MCWLVITLQSFREEAFSALSGDAARWTWNLLQAKQMLYTVLWSFPKLYKSRHGRAQHLGQQPQHNVKWLEGPTEQHFRMEMNHCQWIPGLVRRQILKKTNLPTESSQSAAPQKILCGGQVYVVWGKWPHGGNLNPWWTMPGPQTRCSINRVPIPSWEVS